MDAETIGIGITMALCGWVAGLVTMGVIVIVAFKLLKKKPLGFSVGGNVKVTAEYFDAVDKEREFTPDTIFTISDIRHYGFSRVYHLHNCDDSIRIRLSDFWLERAN